jgi:hypothetical protein
VHLRKCVYDQGRTESNAGMGKRRHGDVGDLRGTESVLRELTTIALRLGTSDVVVAVCSKVW